MFSAVSDQVWRRGQMVESAAHRNRRHKQEAESEEIVGRDKKKIEIEHRGSANN